MFTDGQAFLWRQRLLAERAMRNITDLHVRILLFTQGAIEAGDDQLSHAAIAESLGVGVRTVGDTYRRAKGVGLLAWEAQYREVGGVRRRTVNRYRLAIPATPPEPRPDLRRHSILKSHLSSSLPSCSAQWAEPVVRQDNGWLGRYAAKLEAERRVRRAQLRL
jgi:hypothetical protein